MLDIYGFETFLKNSYEQFCINYANEKLQLQFNTHVFKLEQDEYRREAIDWSFIDYYDNTPCIELIEGSEANPVGMLALLDDECRTRTATDENWAIKIKKALGDREHYREPSAAFGPNNAFVIAHYAGPVCYQVCPAIFLTQHMRLRARSNFC